MEATMENEDALQVKVTSTSTDDEDNEIASSSNSTGIPSADCHDSQQQRQRQRRRCCIYLAATLVTGAIGLAAIGTAVFAIKSKSVQPVQQGGTADPNSTSPGSVSEPPSPFPSLSSTPSPSPTFSPSLIASSTPSAVPSPAVASLVPSFTRTGISLVPTSLVDSFTTTFYAIGDVPYDDNQATNLMSQIQNIPSTAEFIIHVGDLRNASDKFVCYLEEYEKSSAILRLSKVPVFVILGDNDWNDCPNADEGLQYWKKEFMYFETRHWVHNFNITRQPGREENFAFRHRGTLFIGVNLVGGKVLDNVEWSTRLQNQSNWTAEVIRSYRDDISPLVGRVVLFGHANPTQDHNDYFEPLGAFIRDELEDSLPILYLNGDKHEWLYEPEYLGLTSFLRIMVTGGTREPPLKVTVDANGYQRPTDESFVYDRDLENTQFWNSPPLF